MDMLLELMDIIANGKRSLSNDRPVLIRQSIIVTCDDHRRLPSCRLRRNRRTLSHKIPGQVPAR